MENLLTKLPNSWNLWYHYDKDNWKIDGFKKVYSITSGSDFWQLYNNWDKLGGINQRHYFLMQDGVSPIWEDPINKSGGCWSFKISENQVMKLWEDLSVYLVTNNLCPNYSNNIYGLSISLKKNNNSIIKIWNKDSSKNSLNLINKNILNKWGTNIIYIAHVQL